MGLYVRHLFTDKHNLIISVEKGEIILNLNKLRIIVSIFLNWIVLFINRRFRFLKFVYLYFIIPLDIQLFNFIKIKIDLFLWK